MNKERKTYREKLDVVPTELKTQPNWVCYRIESRHGQSKPTKVPYNPASGDFAKANDPSTWCEYESCITAVERGDYEGVGFEFTPPYVGVDLDNCRNPEAGEIEEWAKDVITHLDSYTEISPSGSGVHIIVKGVLPPGRRRIGRIEMYDAARFFTVTGEPLMETEAIIRERTVELAELHGALFDPGSSGSGATIQTGFEQSNLCSDDEIIHLASAAANGRSFEDLWSGSWRGGYNSQSEADLALCCHLAFWTGKDGERIDAMFRKSGLYRQKWLRDDYRNRTIQLALAQTNDTYSMSHHDRTHRHYAAFASKRAAQRDCPEKLPPTSEAHNDFEFRLTDLGNSERFIVQHGEDLRFCAEAGQWLTWNGVRWEQDNLRRVSQLAKATVKTMYAELPKEPDDDKRKALFKHILRSESERSLGAMVSLAKTDSRIVVSAGAFDTQPHLLNCLNGTIDLRTGTLLPHRREDLLTKRCPVQYDPAAKSQVWQKFLNDCTNGDVQFQAFLQRACGYSIFGDPREQVIIMVAGPGGTGKSTFIGVLQAVLGDYAVTADFSTFLKKERISSGPSDDIACLAGARLVSSIEVDDGQKLAEAMLKQLTGGDMIRARKLYQSSFEFKPQMTLWLVCNHLPVVSHDDDAIWRRLLRLPFENKVPAAKQDKSLKAQLTDLEATGPAILAWMVQGCVDWNVSGLQIPKLVQQATATYKTKSNPLTDFVNEGCILDARAFSTSSELRSAYDQWCRDGGEKAALNRNQFADALRELGCVPANRGAGRGWKGISIRNEKNLYALAVKSTTSEIDALFEELGPGRILL